MSRILAEYLAEYRAEQNISRILSNISRLLAECRTEYSGCREQNMEQKELAEYYQHIDQNMSRI